jgi:microcystin degradation protein MlrC
MMHSGVLPAKRRVLIGQIFQETHGFTPLTTSLDAFAVETGERLLSNNADADSVLGGLIRVGLRSGWTLIPTLAARASPGGRVTDEAYAFIKQSILDRARRGGFDAIALCLHGCMQTETLDSAEADLLFALRHIVGPDLPIVAGFDLHAHAGGGMLAHLDFASAYKTNPHADAGLTGERVGMTLSRMLDTGLKPAAAMLTVPMLTSGNDETGTGPLAMLHAMARDRVASDEDLLDVSIFNVNPFVDGQGVGQTVLVYARNESAWPSAQKLAKELGDGLWALRSAFRHDLPTVSSVLADARSTLVLGDFGDRVLAGGPGDSIYVLAEVLKSKSALRVLAPLTDPAAVLACMEAGVGASLTLHVGGCHSHPGHGLRLDGVVRSVGKTASYRNRGAFMKGATLPIGPHAVFSGERFVLLLTKDPLMSQDPGCFLDVGIDLACADVIVVKSGYHFKLAFDEIGACVCVSTPGLTNYDPAGFDFSKARPLYPLDDFEYVARGIRVAS